LKLGIWCGNEQAGRTNKPSTGYPTAQALARYRCFLPDLAGLAGLRRVGPMPDT